jgi:hypothetical protein
MIVLFPVLGTIFTGLSSSIVFIATILFSLYNIGFYVLGQNFKTNLIKKRNIMVYIPGLVLCGLSVWGIIEAIVNF